jgi:hypothetical protein
MLCSPKVCNVFFNSLKIFITTQCYGSALVSWFHCESNSEYRVLMAKNWKILQLKDSYFWSKIAKYSIYPEASVKDVQASGKASSPQKENIQHFKTTIFYFLYFFAYLDPGQDDQNHQNQCGSGSATLLKINVILDKA